MRAVFWWSFALALVLSSCGGAAPRAATPSDTSSLDDAIATWAEGAVGEAGTRALMHLEARPESTIARELAARAALAGGDTEGALRLTRDQRSEPLVRLRAAAHLARDEYVEAARALGSLPGADEDPWASAIADIASAAGDRALHRRSGAANAELAMVRECALPVITMRVEGREVLALIATSVHLTVLSPELRAGHGVVDELELDRMRVHDVPFVVRDLALESAALGVAIGAVVGVDLLGRLGATIDGPGARVRLGEHAVIEHVPTARFDGSVLAVRAAIDARPAWMLLDTAGAFAVALSPRGAERMGASDGVLARIGLGRELVISDVPLRTGIVGDELEQSTTAPIDGAIGWGLLAQLVVTLDRGGVSLVAPGDSP